jgi:hypothetical protein
MYAKVREHGAPVQGAAGWQARKAEDEMTPQTALKSFISLHVGGVLDPGEACRNRVTLSGGRHGPRQRVQLCPGMFRAKRI